MPDQISQISDLYAELKRKAMQTFLFDNDDLTSNREGKLSHKQKQVLMANSKSALVVFVFSGLVLSLMLVVFILTSHKPITPLTWVFPIFCLGSLTAMGIRGYWLGSKVCKSGTVKCVVGAATFLEVQGETFLQIDGKYFRLYPPKKFREIFTPNLQYKIYYVSSGHDNAIASIEIDN